MDQDSLGAIDICIQQSKKQHADLLKSTETKRKELLAAEDEVRRRRAELKRTEDEAFNVKRRIARLEGTVDAVKDLPHIVAAINSGKLPGARRILSNRPATPTPVTATTSTPVPLSSSNAQGVVGPVISPETRAPCPALNERQEAQQLNSERLDGTRGGNEARRESSVQGMEVMDGNKQKKKKRQAEDGADGSKQERKKQKKKHQCDEAVADHMGATGSKVGEQAETERVSKRKRTKLEPEEIQLS
ncbi:hypothetical protein CALCODRAFT_496409 [Calocera cornea HHB12733]|uniref:Uncharacterized protein n=1 Tax=Calocera cornea HHB12733 TaxID=1353952 RepID=A0A165FW24_9BASI|nr:hypothetical protein CALCODRAFT_496409 [Calocera cornea HHB12733]